MKALIKEKKQFEPGFGAHALADAARIQRPYLSKVLKGSAQLSPDQMFLISRFLRWTDDEHDYVQLLLECARTGLNERRTQLEERIRSIRSRHLDSSTHLSAKQVQLDAAANAPMADYYLDPIFQIVHIAISIEQFSRNPSLLAAELQITGSHLHAILNDLERMGLAYRERGRLMPREPSLHLPKTSPLYRAWRNQLKFLSTHKLNQLDDSNAYSFSTVFSANTKVRDELHERFLAFLKESEVSVRDAQPRQVYQLTFDLFSWTSGR